MAELEARRRALIGRCEAQRADLRRRLAEAKRGPIAWLRAGLSASDGATEGGRRVRHPIAWTVAVVALLLLGRPRQVVAALAWTRSALTLLARANQVLSVISALRRRHGEPAAAERHGGLHG
jgi:hypothetical protein